MEEQWRDVVGFETAYQVSSHGHFFNKRTGGPVALLKRGRYLAVSLKAAPRKAVKAAHVCVAEAFLGPRPLGKQVAHLDGNAHNNRVDNLAYVT